MFCFGITGAIHCERLCLDLQMMYSLAAVLCSWYTDVAHPGKCFTKLCRCCPLFRCWGVGGESAAMVNDFGCNLQMLHALQVFGGCNL